MATTNGFTLANKKADIEIENAAGDVYGFQSLQPVIPESRASQLTASTGESSPTAKSAEPFETVEWSDWSYGMGQVNGDRQGGGPLGQGGNPSAYFSGDCFSLRPDKLLPGMARDMVYNTVNAAVQTPITDGLDPNAGDEYEVPRGVVPFLFKKGGPVEIASVNWQVGGSVTVTAIRALVFVRSASGSGGVPPATYATLTATMAGSTYSATVSSANLSNYTGWKWLTLTKQSGTGIVNTLSTKTIFFSTDTAEDLAIGCYVNTAGGFSDLLRPYFQILTSATPFKYWGSALQKMEQMTNNLGSYVNIAITNSALFSVSSTGLAYAATSSPEVPLTGTYVGSIFFNGKLYVSTTSGTAAWSVSAAANNQAPTNALDAGIILKSPVEGLGKIICVGSDNALYTWTGNFPVSGADAAVKILNAGVIGQSGTNINRIQIFQGSIYVFKPEGVFKIIAAIGDISTVKAPEVIQVWSPPGNALVLSTGLWGCEHQGKLYFSWKAIVYEMVMQEDKPVITPYNPSPPWYRLSYYSYINGLTSDGVNLYMSLNNYGVVAHNGLGYHTVTEFFEQVATEGQPSGLKWLPNPLGAPDTLFCGDGRTIVNLPIPNNFQPYTSQIYQRHQNKCGYLITSEWTGSFADIEKNIRSVILRATPNGWSYKLIGVVRQANTSSSFRTLLEKTFMEGLLRDDWNKPYSTTPDVTQVVTQKIDPNSGTVLANTLAPACFVSADFDNSAYQSKKLAVRTTDTTVTPNETESVSNPVKIVKTQFILYFWNPSAGQSLTGVEVSAVDAIVVKHLPKLKYVARYQVSLDLTKLAHIGSSPQGVASVNAMTAWLRNQAVAGDPLYFRFVDTTGAVKEVEGILQGYSAQPQVTDKGHTNLFPLRADFSILSINEEDPV